MKKITIFFIAFLFLFISVCTVRASYNSADYRVGVDYYSTSYSEADVFIGQYNQPAVRTLVLSQLQDMANAGVKAIKTPIWLTGPGQGQTNLNRNFPLSTQELENISQYATDVSLIRGKDGNYLDLYLGFGWLNCADYHYAPCGGGWDSYIVPNAEKTFDDFFATIGNLTRPDGKKAVSLAYAEGEVIIGNWDSGAVIKPNTDKFLTILYPYFISDANKYGITPSIYFIIQGPESKILNNSYKNTAYPAINNHASLDYIYPTTEFMRKNNIPIPTRLDMSIYVDASSSGYTTLINRVMDDLKAVYPNNDIGVAETYYFQDPVMRRQMGQAFANRFLTQGEPKEIFFWPGADINGGSAVFQWPYDIASYLPATPGDLNVDGKVDINDYSILMGNFGKTGTGVVGDIDANGKVDVFDYNILVGNFGK